MNAQSPEHGSHQSHTPGSGTPSSGTSARASQAGTSRLDRLADRILSLDSVVYGDERQRRITLEGCAFAWTLSVYLMQICGVIAAALGDIGTSLAFMLLAPAIALSASWYAKRRTVDFEDLARRDTRLLHRTQALMMFVVALWCAALAYYAYAGHGLIQMPDSFAIREGDTSVVGGMAVGGVIGAVIGGIMQAVKSRRAPKSEPELEPDDEF